MTQNGLSLESLAAAELLDELLEIDPVTYRFLVCLITRQAELAKKSAAGCNLAVMMELLRSRLETAR